MHQMDGLVNALKDQPAGLCGHHEPACAVEVIEDTELRLRALALGAILDVFPVVARWEQIAALADHWLLQPVEVAYRESSEVEAAMKEQHIDGPRHNARVWWQVLRGVQGRFNGEFRAMLAAQGDDAIQMQQYLRDSKTTFPVLSGPVISAQWLDLVHRVGGVPLQQWDALVVDLSAGQQQAAQSFGVKATRAHPATAAGLSIWRRACERREPPACGLDHCPRRHSAIERAPESGLQLRDGS